MGDIVHLLLCVFLRAVVCRSAAFGGFEELLFSKKRVYYIDMSSQNRTIRSQAPTANLSLSKRFQSSP